MMEWLFEKRAKAFAEAVRRDPELYLSGDWLEQGLLSLMNKAYEMGCDDPAAKNEHITKGVEIGLRIARPAIPVTDFSELPEIIERIKDRWKSGSCH